MQDMTDTHSSLSAAAQLLQDLIRCPSVTPIEGGALDLLQARLESLGFLVQRKVFSKPDTPDVENLYARLGTQSPNLCFAGHTDVVPVGDEKEWSSHPFEGEVVDGFMIGRGAVDMKGGIACFIAAVEDHLKANGSVPGSISLLITGDEEGPAVNGTTAILDWLVEGGEIIDACVVGEPTNPNQIGDAIKIGRRGSISGTVEVTGVQGHAAYPHLADNPARGITALVGALLEKPYDSGTKDFQPTNLEVTSIDIGNPAFNVIPSRATARFNIRFNDTWTADTIKQEIEARLDQAAKDPALRPKLNGVARPPVDWSVTYTERPSHVFLTNDEKLIASLSSAVKSVTGAQPELSTGGGTSDARFIKDVCPVVEFGLVGQTMHQVDERVALPDLETLTEIYGKFLTEFFKQEAS
ncbi:MAG: succinyl-diaminopimelate desuccinylase [Rhizobiaceae bacterium]|nr:succinyl-diaminopimelate desuccinylase [Hyphomicrobiales bacterium]NRB29188.1 succinyl-diaminopimelate desuccinylase [Rhizobiaceae bacterium]